MGWEAGLKTPATPEHLVSKHKRSPFMFVDLVKPNTHCLQQPIGLHEAEGWVGSGQLRGIALVLLCQRLSTRQRKA